MLATLVPASVVVETGTAATPADALHPAEDAALGRVVEPRRQEFTLVRHLARIALRRLGAPAGPLLPGEHREPRWPPGVRGSLTHCDDYAAAAVAWSRDVASVGVDAEPNLPLPDGVVDLVALPAEREWIAAGDGTVARDRLLFSAKEAVYKAWFPLTGRWLGFEEAHLDFNGDAFRAALVSPAAVEAVGLPAFDGHFAVDGGLILTAVTVPAEEWAYHQGT